MAASTLFRRLLTQGDTPESRIGMSTRIETHCVRFGQMSRQQRPLSLARHSLGWRPQSGIGRPRPADAPASSSGRGTTTRLARGARLDADGSFRLLNIATIARGADAFPQRQRRQEPAPIHLFGSLPGLDLLWAGRRGGRGCRPASGALSLSRGLLRHRCRARPGHRRCSGAAGAPAGRRAGAGGYAVRPGGGAADGHREAARGAACRAGGAGDERELNVA
jgi:hypothetical protein